MDYDELVQRLRAAAATWEVDPDEIADAITQLRAERDALKDELRRTCEHLGLDQLLAERDALQARVAELTDELQIECAARQTALAERDALRALLREARAALPDMRHNELLRAKLDAALAGKDTT